MRAGQSSQLDRGTAVHDHAQARGAGSLGGGGVDHAELQPDRLGADRDRLVDVRAGLRGAPEDVDDVDRLVDVVHARDAALPEDLVRVGVDRDHAEAAALQQRRDPVRVAGGVGRAPDHRPGARLLERVADVLFQGYFTLKRTTGPSCLQSLEPLRHSMRYACQ